MTANLQPIFDLLTQLLQIVEEILEWVRSTKKAALSVDPMGVYDNSYVKQLLHIQDKYLKKLRDDGYLAYSREGDKYWYRGRDIIAMLDHYYFEAFSTKKDLPKA